MSEDEFLVWLADWMDHYGTFWRERIADLRTLLEELDP